jgi:hypothetical protein
MKMVLMIELVTFGIVESIPREFVVDTRDPFQIDRKITDAVPLKFVQIPCKTDDEFVWLILNRDDERGRLVCKYQLEILSSFGDEATNALMDNVNVKKLLTIKVPVLTLWQNQVWNGHINSVGIFH